MAAGLTVRGWIASAQHASGGHEARATRGSLGARVASICASICVGAALLFGAATGAQAATYTLAELVSAADDFRFDSVDGLLSFGNFEATISGVLVSDLSQYTVETNAGVITDGFQLIGMIGVAGGNAADIRLQYDVFSNAGAIVGAQMYFNGRARGNGALANISEDFFALPGLALQPEGLAVFATGGSNGVSQLIDATDFGDPVTAMRVVKDIQVISDGGIYASISVIDQHFTVVPEPSSALLFAVGMSGLTLLRKRHRPGRA